MILENRNSVKISDMPNEIRSVSIGAFDMIADFWDLGGMLLLEDVFLTDPLHPTILLFLENKNP